jgi:hypothetical protein
VLKVASRHSVLARKLRTSASVKGAVPVLAARAAGGGEEVDSSGGWTAGWTSQLC